MVENHWEQLVLGLGYQFWSFWPQKRPKNWIVATTDKYTLKALF